ncbi:hypothetical protein GF362_03540 [Candidatus Dojkabacteria bacterium]|nr:hypothetical protein [Candidatus Dojkabacteria bacterium]
MKLRPLRKVKSNNVKYIGLFSLAALALLATGLLVMRMQSGYQTGEESEASEVVTPCDFAPDISSCTYDTKTVYEVDGVKVESITAYGRIFNFDVNGNPWPNKQEYTKLLTAIPRYAKGPCKGKIDDKCVFEGRIVEEIRGELIETVVAYGKTYKFDEQGNAF